MGMEPIQPKPSDLRVIGLLGSGQFASVWRVGSGNATTEYALKRCCKRIAAREHKGIENLLEEKRVHDMLHHAMIVRLLTSFQARLPCWNRLTASLSQPGLMHVLATGRGDVQLSAGAVRRGRSGHAA